MWPAIFFFLPQPSSCCVRFTALIQPDLLACLFACSTCRHWARGATLGEEVSSSFVWCDGGVVIKPGLFIRHHSALGQRGRTAEAPVWSGCSNWSLDYLAGHFQVSFSLTDCGRGEFVITAVWIVLWRAFHLSPVVVLLSVAWQAKPWELIGMYRVAWASSTCSCLVCAASRQVTGSGVGLA